MSAANFAGLLFKIPMTKKVSHKIKEAAASNIRPPVVAVLGHIDHGKTTLLDYIRKTKVAEGEAGAITQHMGAYQVKAREHVITFLDTPGHAAFVGVRTQGLSVADIALLVVAADEGVKEQTKEALALIQEQKLPFIAVLNKVDKPEAQVDRVKKQLAELQVFIEEWGGDVPVALVSAKTGQGVDELLEVISLMGEIKGLKAEVNQPAQGVVLDGVRDAKRGAVLALLVRDGTLKVGDIIVAGQTMGRVRALEDFAGAAVKTAGPSMPVRVVGLKEVAASGTIFTVVENLKAAQTRAAEARVQSARTSQGRVMKVEAPDMVYLVIKADQQGSLAAINHALKTFTTQETHYKVIRAEVGNVSMGDVEVAAPLNALILGFQVSVLPDAQTQAKHHNLAVHTFPIIYDLLDAVKAAIEGKLKPVLVRYDIASLKVVAVFKQGKQGMIVGCRINDGLAKRGSKFEVVRDGAVVGAGKITELRQAKEQVGSVAKGRDCGVAFEGATAQAGDELKLYEEREEIPTLESLKNAQRS